MKNDRIVLQAQRHIRTLSLARDCAALGARIRTIQLLSGLSASQLHRLFLHPLSGPRRGRHPDSSEWYHTANLLCRTEASIVVALYRRLAMRGIDPPQALVGAYRHYLSSCSCVPRISFDRAFDLISHTAGRWLANERSFSMFTCPDCRSEYLTSMSLAPFSNRECPFCKLVLRYPKDPRLQASYPTRISPRTTRGYWIGACWSSRVEVQAIAKST